MHRFPSRTNGNRCFSILIPNPLCLYSICFYRKSILLFESCHFSCSRIDFEGENVSTDVLRCGAYSARLFFYSLVSRVLASQRSLIMMRVCGRSLPLIVCFLICIITFELQSESNAIVFSISWLFLLCWFWCV